MKVLLKTPPTLEPITLTELLLHLRQDSDDIATALTTAQSILPGSHAIADNYTTHAGTGVSVLGKTAIVNLNAGTVGEGGTVDAKIQESNDNATWTDWAGGAFTQVKADNDNAIQEKQYTGSMAYIRVAAADAPRLFEASACKAALMAARNATPPFASAVEIL